MRHRIIQNKRKSWYHSPILAVFLGLLTIWGGVVVVKTYLKYREARALRNQYQAELESLQAKQTELNGKIGELSTERGIEAEVRNRYRVVKPGESLVIVVDEEKGSATAQVDQPNVSWWVKLRTFIGL